MKYVECLELIKKNNLNLNQMVVAKEVYDQLVVNHVINNYEVVCHYIYSCSLDLTEPNSISIETLVQCFKDMISEDDYTEEKILNMQYYKFIEKASYY